MPAVERDILDDALAGLAAAIWRQVARDLGSSSPSLREPAVRWLMSEMAVTWAYRFDPDIEPEVAIQLLLVDVGRRPVRNSRHQRQRMA
jgi:hypothetical protein